MQQSLIFFKEDLGKYKWQSQLNVNDIYIDPIACSLTDGSKGYYLGSYWDAELTRQNVKKRTITRDEIVTNPK